MTVHSIVLMMQQTMMLGVQRARCHLCLFRVCPAWMETIRAEQEFNIIALLQ